MAIAFDTGVVGVSLTFGGTASWSHTFTGSDGMIFAGGWSDGIGNPFDLSFTLNGSAMTLADKIAVTGDRWLSLFWGIPVSGSNSIVASSAGVLSASSSSYSGVDPSGPTATATDPQNGGTSGIKPITTISTVVAGQWLIGISKDAQGLPNSPINWTERVADRSTIGDSNGSVGAAGSYNQQVPSGSGGASGNGLVTVAIKAVTASSKRVIPVSFALARRSEPAWLQ